jgi:hypothetical protein
MFAFLIAKTICFRAFASRSETLADLHQKTLLLIGIAKSSECKAQIKRREKKCESKTSEKEDEKFPSDYKLKL